MSQPHERRIFGLDLLRAIAIGLVLVTHAARFFEGMAPRRLMEALVLGDVGVDLFFVMSGFLIGGILLRDLERGASARDLLRFWSRRWWRTLPNYYLFLALNAAAGLWLLGDPFPSKAYLVFGQSMLWPHPSFFSESWSLCVEEWFYLLFPALAFAGTASLSKDRSYLMSAVAVASASFAARAWFVFVGDCRLGMAQHAALLRLDSMMFGVVAAWIAARWPDRWRESCRPAAVAGLLLLAAGLALRFRLSQWSAFTRFAYFDVVGLGVALLLPSLSGWRSAGGRAAAMVTGASIASYSMYLINLPLREIMIQHVTRPEGWALAGLMTALWLAVTCGLSWLCYHGYESRMTRLRDVDWRAALRGPAPARARRLGADSE
jgi:peptidoglycan/LPS O-acetylase OafA/YrhL